MKKIRLPALLLAAALLLLPGCNIIKVNADRDGAQVVAEVNGENITKLEVYQALKNYAAMANLYGSQIPYYDIGKKVDSWNLQSFISYKENMLNSLIQDKVTQQKAKEQGMYTFTADEQKTIDDYVTKNSTGLDDTAKAKLRKSEEDTVALGKLKKTITDKVTVADTDVKTQYDSDVTSQQTSYDKDPTQAVTDDNNGATLVYYPDGTIRVRQILIPLPADIKSQISTDRTTNTTESNAAADKLRSDELAKIKAKADEALQKAKDANGDLTKLDQLIKDTGNNDPGMDSKPAGYLVCKDTTAYVTEFTTAALALTDVGKPSDLVATDFGYHILWIVSKPAKGAVAYDTIKDKLTESVKTSKQDTAWSNQLETWVSDMQKANKIKTYIGRLNN